MLQAWKFQVPNINSSDLRGPLELHLDCFHLMAVKITRYFFLQSIDRLKRFALWLGRSIALVFAWTTCVNKAVQAVSGHLSAPNNDFFDPVEQATSVIFSLITLLVANDDPTTSVTEVVNLQQTLNWKSHYYVSAEFISIHDTNWCRNSFIERKIM